MKRFTRLFRKFLEVTQKENNSIESTKRKWTRIKINVFGKYLLVTNTLSSGLSMVAGDLMSQEIEYQRGVSKKRFDYERSGWRKFGGIALAIASARATYVCARPHFFNFVEVDNSQDGPINHFFYGWIDRAIKVVNLANVSKKILLDQLIMSPVCILAFFYSAGLLNGQSTKECTDELKIKFLTVYMTDWTVWPITQFVNFYYLHPKYRVIYVNFVTMLYNVFLSCVKHDDSNYSDNSN